MDRPKIGAGVLIMNGNQVLLGKRINSHGAGCWQAPGGHLEFGEKPEERAIHEVLEENGLCISELKRGSYTNDYFRNELKHYVTLFIIAKYRGGIPKLLEPEKNEEWCWFSWDSLPTPLFLPIENLINQGFSPY